MILLDTHIWIWWIHNDNQLNQKIRGHILSNEENGLGISVFSCWEVSKLVEIKRLTIHCPIEDWIDAALDYPGIRLLELTPQIAVESTKLPGKFHRDPADQIIVATARIWDCPLLTVDEKILNYQYVNLLK